MDRMQPSLRQYRPARDRQLRRTKPKPVPPLRKKMKFCRNLRILQRLKVDKRVLDVSRVVILSLNQKGRRSFRGWLQRGTYLAVRTAKPPGIDDHLKVGTSIDGGCWNILPLKVGMSAENCGKVSSSRESNHPDVIRVDVPFGGVSASEPHRLLRVFQIFDIFRIMTFFRHSILHQNTRHTERVEPITDLSSFNVVRKSDITSPGKHERSSTVVLRRVRRIDSKARFADIRNPNSHFAGDDAVGIRSRIDLRPNHL